MLAHMNKNRMAGGMLIPLLLFLVVGVGKVVVDDPPAGGNTTTTVPAACPGAVHYFRHDLPVEVNHFGPAAPDNDVNAALAELHNRRCVDPALTVAHRQYQARNYTSPEERLFQTEGLANNPEAWALNVLALEEREAIAVKVEVVDMTESYQTLYMVDTPVPTIYQDVVDRPKYKVIRFTYADGSVDNLKLDCGFQPVEPIFPGIPGPPAPGGSVTPSGDTPTPTPGPGPGPNPPTTCDPRVCKGPAPATPPPCIDNAGVRCTVQPGAGGEPGKGGAINRGNDGYSPEDPPPPTWVAPAPAPTSVVTVPPTTAPPPPSQNINPGVIPG